MAIVDVGRHMVIDPEVMHGRLTFKGTRVPVSTVMAFLAKGDAVDDIVRQWPQVSREAVQEAIRLASEALHHRYQVELLIARDEARWLQEAGFTEPEAEVAGS